jgi:hypothetical protein
MQLDLSLLLKRSAWLPVRKYCVNGGALKYARNEEQARDRARDYHCQNKEKRHEYDAQYRLLRKDKISERKRKYRVGNLDKLNDYARQYRSGDNMTEGEITFRYRDKNIDKLSEYYQEYCAQNKKRIRESTRGYYFRNKDKLNGFTRDNYIRHLDDPDSYLARNVTMKSWKTPALVREYFDAVAKQLCIANDSDWYRISRENLIRNFGGVFALNSIFYSMGRESNIFKI